MPSPVQPPTGDYTVLVGSEIALLVVTSDQQLAVLCREVLRDLSETFGGFSADSDQKTPYRICLWDFDSAKADPNPDELESDQTLYLAPPWALGSLLRMKPYAEGHILLKPVTKAVLQSFILSATPLREKGPLSLVPTLRANRDDLLQRLLEANLRLQQYDQERTNFIARAIHDFRAPLTALSGFCGLLAGGELGALNDQQVEALKRMGHAANRISRMTSAMFELSIASKVVRKPDLREDDILERIKQALHEISPLAREKQISVRADEIVPPDKPLYFEPSEMEQVLINLLDNACKFTRREGAIEVRGYPYFWERRFLVRGSSPSERRQSSIRQYNSYRIDIKDTGPGIPFDRLNHIFEEYTSYAGPQDRSGGGLGLAICRLIMSRHEGHIWADSHENGAMFSFVLPYQTADVQGKIPNSVAE